MNGLERYHSLVLYETSAVLTFSCAFSAVFPLRGRVSAEFLSRGVTGHLLSIVQYLVRTYAYRCGRKVREKVPASGRFLPVRGNIRKGDVLHPRTKPPRVLVLGRSEKQKYLPGRVLLLLEVATPTRDRLYY